MQQKNHREKFEAPEQLVNRAALADYMDRLKQLDEYLQQVDPSNDEALKPVRALIQSSCAIAQKGLDLPALAPTVLKKSDIAASIGNLDAISKIMDPLSKHDFANVDPKNDMYLSWVEAYMALDQAQEQMNSMGRETSRSL